MLEKIIKTKKRPQRQTTARLLLQTKHPPLMHRPQRSHLPHLFQTAFDTCFFWNLAMTNAQTEAKVNLATLPFLIPKCWLGSPLGEKQSFQLDVMGSFWDEQPLLDDTPFHVNQAVFEYRWYQQSDTQNWFVGSTHWLWDVYPSKTGVCHYL